MVEREGRTVNKTEAISVLREIFAACPEIGNADFVSLDPIRASGTGRNVFRIRLRANLNCDCRDTINAILDKYKLKIAQTKDVVVIYRPQSSKQ